MLIAGVLTFDAEGRIVLSADPPDYFNGGTPTTAAGELSAEPEADPEVFIAAIGYLDDGRLTAAVSPLLPPVGPFGSDTGQVRVSTGVPTHWYAGLPMTADGRLSISPGIVPPEDLGAFNNAFSNAFDIGD